VVVVDVWADAEIPMFVYKKEMFPYTRNKRKLGQENTPIQKIKKPLDIEETQLAAGMTMEEQEKVWQYFCKACAKYNK